MRKFLLLCGAIFFLLFVEHVLAIGITPGRTTLDYVPGSVQTYSFTVVNSQQENADIVILLGGELNASISVSEVSFRMEGSQTSKSLTYTLTMPSGLKPGLHTAEIIALQLPPKTESEGTFVGAAVAVATQVHIHVPYPGKYLETSLDIAPVEDQAIRFIVPVVSRGELTIVRAKATIDIYTSLNQKVDTFSTDELSIKSLERRELVAVWQSQMPPGKYRAVATVIYDEQTTTIEKEFLIGDELLEINSIEVNDFSLGDIAKFEILVENKWSDAIKGAFLQMHIFNEEGEVMADIKSQTYDVNALEKELMTVFWDTDGVDTGTYDSSLFLHFGKQSTKQDLKLDVSEDDITVIGLGYVIKSAGGKSDSNSLVIVLSTAIGILLLLNLVWFLIVRKKLAPKKQ